MANSDGIFSEFDGKKVNITAYKAFLSKEIVKQVIQQALESEGLNSDALPIVRRAHDE